MTVGDMPTFVPHMHASAAYDPTNFAIPMAAMRAANFGKPFEIDLGVKRDRSIGSATVNEWAQALSEVRNRNQEAINNPQETVVMSAGVRNDRRLVQIFIVDPNENVPLDKCLLYKGEEKLTDLNDQELFFELDIKGLLEAWNVERVKIMDKRVKDRQEFLEPAKVRDLKMIVTTIASF